MKSLKSELLNVSKHKISIISDMAIKDADVLKELMDVALCDEDPVCWHAAWAVNHVGRKDSEALIPYVPAMVKKIQNSENESQMGSLMRALSETNFSLDENGSMIDVCYDFLGQDRPLFIKAYAMLLLKKIVTIEPALSRETILVLEKCMPFFGRDYLERKAKQLIKYLRKI